MVSGRDDEARPTEAEVEAQILYVDAALALGGHAVTDPVLPARGTLNGKPIEVVGVHVETVPLADNR